MCVKYVCKNSCMWTWFGFVPFLLCFDCLTDWLCGCRKWSLSLQKWLVRALFLRRVLLFFLKNPYFNFSLSLQISLNVLRYLAGKKPATSENMTWNLKNVHWSYQQNMSKWEKIWMQAKIQMHEILSGIGQSDNCHKQIPNGFFSLFCTYTCRQSILSQFRGVWIKQRSVWLYNSVFDFMGE